MKVRNLLVIAAASMVIANPTAAASKAQICPRDLAGAKAITAPLSATGEPTRTPSSGYELVTFERPNISREGRPIQKVVVERSAQMNKGTGHYLISFYAPGTATDLVLLLKTQLPATKCEDGFCSGGVASYPGAEGLLEYGSVQELRQGKVEVVVRCKYRDDAYGKLIADEGLAAGR